MNKFAKLSGFMIASFAVISCQTEKAPVSASQLLDNYPVVGEYVQVGDDKVLSCEQKLLTDTIHLPLSFFTEEMEIVKLDDRKGNFLTRMTIMIYCSHL